MKGIFVVFHGFASHNGISKKIFYQKKALASLGHDVRLCYPLIDANDGHYKRMLDDFVLEDYGTGITAKIKKRICYIKEKPIKNNAACACDIPHRHTLRAPCGKRQYQTENCGCKLIQKHPHHLIGSCFE